MSAATMEKSLEVFQGLKLRGPVEKHGELYEAIVSALVPLRWHGAELTRTAKGSS